VTEMDSTTNATDAAPLTRGVLLEQGDGYVVLGKPETEYRVRLECPGALDAPVGSRVMGRIVAQPKRIDTVETGGRFIEPLYGRPRRVQGRVMAVDTNANRIVISTPLPITLQVGPGQHARDFTERLLVSCDVEPGARWEPAAS
jgi:hypothetical protein